MPVPSVVDRIGPEEAAVAAQAIDTLLVLHQNVRDAFPGVPRLQHQALLASIAQGLRADYQPRACELVPADRLRAAQTSAGRLRAEAERQWMPDVVRARVEELLAAIGDLVGDRA